MAKRWINSVDVEVVEARRIKISASSDAAAGNTLIPAVTGKGIYVLAMCLMAADPVNATFYSGPGDTGTAISGPMPLSANGGFVLPAPSDAAMHWLQTAPGQALTLLLDTAVQVSGWLIYYEG